MKPRPSLLSRLAALFRRRKPNPVSPVPPPRESKVRGIEPLEGRIAPATFTANSVSYTDLDGDLVTVTFSKNLFDPTKSVSLNNLDDIFTFTNGTGDSPFSDSGPQQLQRLDLTQARTFPGLVFKAQGASVRIMATQAGGGDGFTNVGSIEASEIALGTVRVDGDLGQIDCGRDGSAIGLNALFVNSLFKFGLTTQVSGVNATDGLESRITGQLTTLRVATDLHGFVHSLDGLPLPSGQTVALADIENVIVGGSLIGNATAATSSNNTGLILSERTIGNVQVLGTGDGVSTAGLIGGGGLNSGAIIATTGITSVTIADSIVAGAGANSGSVLSRTVLSAITVGDDLVGGSGANSGTIQARTLGTATITDDIIGGTAIGSGAITIERGATSILISGDVTGGTGANSGGISTGGPLGSVIVRGNLTGGDGFHSGSILGGTDIGLARVLGTVTGDDGDRSGTIMASGRITTAVAGELVGGAGPNSGSIFSGFDLDRPGDIANVFVRDGMTGGTGISSGSIISGGIGSLRVGTAAANANVEGGAGNFSGAIIADGPIATASIFGTVQGGGGAQSGSIQSNGLISNVSITGSLLGGGGELSGSIIAHDALPAAGGGLLSGISLIGSIANITVGGDISGGAGAKSGRVQADVSIIALSATALEGGAGTESGSIAAGLVRPGGLVSAAFSGAITSIAGGAAPSITVAGRLGALTVGAGITDGVIRAGRDIGSVVVDGAVNNTVFSAVGVPAPAVATGNVAIGRILVRGDVVDSQILAGYDTAGDAVNADASIGTVRVIGNWTASDIVAGVQDTNGDGFGNADDVKIAGGTNRTDLISQIAAINISGTITGTAAGGDHFGFIAQRILSLRNGGVPLGFTAAPNQSFELGATGDVTAREVAV